MEHPFQEEKIYSKREFFFMVFVNSLVLALSFIVFLMLMNVNDMQKREYAYRYIQHAGCTCQEDVSILVDRTKDIKFGELERPIPGVQTAPIDLSKIK